MCVYSPSLLCEKKKYADNIQTIHSHKYVLATGSSVFYAMFYGGLAENKKEIKVPDVEPSAFLTLLK